MDSKRIYIYSESEPVDRNVVAHGLYRAAPPLLRSIQDFIEGIAIYPMGRRFTDCDLDPELAHLCTSLPRVPTVLSKLLRRYPALDVGIADAIPVRLLASAIRRSKADTLFCFIGADIQTLTRAARLAAFAGKSYSLYVVDDFLSPLHVAGMSANSIQKAAKQAQTVLRGARYVFTISDGLGELLRQNYGVSATTLLLAFEPDPRPILPAKKQIIFVGSMNFLYAEGLRDLFKVVEHVRRSSGTDLTVRLTVPASVATAQLGELPPFVLSAPVETSEGLAREIASSLFAFLPYTFDLRHKTMVSTSFPSKSMEYLAYARSIVVYGPDYGAATKLFRERKLPSIASSPTELEEMTQSHLKAWPEHSAIYRSYLEEAHSLKAARNSLCAGLGLKMVDAGPPSLHVDPR